MSVIAAFASFSSLAFFVALGFVGNGVITVMINSPWQADDDADNQSGIIAVTLLAHQSLWPFRPLLWIFAIRAVSLVLELTITSARQWSPDIAATVDYTWRISRSIIGKAPRSLICCNASVLTFRREVFQAKLLAVGIPPAGKKLVASGACWFEFWV